MVNHRLHRFFVLAAFFMLAVLTSNGVRSAASTDHPDWPWQCGSNVIGKPYEIVRFLRFYPSIATALRNTVLHLPSPGVVLPYSPIHDNYDLLTGFVTENETGTFRNVVYISAPIVDGEPLSIIVPLWFPNDIVDTDDFKLRNAAGVVPNPFDPDNPNNSNLPRGGGMIQGSTNYPCIARIRDTIDDDTKTLVYLQGYVYRSKNLEDYFSPL